MAKGGGDGSIILTTKVDESGLKKGFGSIKKMSAVAGKAFLAIGAMAVGATVAITKMAVSAYADYEQLTGGVETLFKESASKVMEYANDAFYTAGVSANEYMQQVTSFSASLISSLSGDTEKAADVANMALIDISDNANKMGSSLESVTLAYQGFAKGQYMLLDNLKLGYGGTKTEMERLLKDAEAYLATQGKTAKFSINNLADVYTAINAIQQKLDIAGTTAKEAEKTISGSANMMKASWQNVLSAIAGGGDLDRAINNLVYSIQKYFENIVPVVERSLVGIGQLIEKVAPMLVQNVASALIQAIPSLINAIFQMIVGLAKGIWQGIKALFTGGSGSVEAQIKTSVGGISDATAEATDGMNDLGDATEKAGKQAKKSLASFDDLSILSSGGGAGGSSGTSAMPSISGGGISPDAVSSEMEIVTEDEGKVTFLDSLLQRLEQIKTIFLSGFWHGFQDADFMPILKSLSSIKESLSTIFLNEEVQKSASGFVDAFVLALGRMVGSFASIGVTITKAVLGGIGQYLKENSSFIKNSIVSMFDATTEIVRMMGQTWVAIANVFSSASGESGQQIVSSIVSVFANAGLSVWNLALQFGADFMRIFSTAIVDNQGALKKAFENTLKIINKFLSPITDTVNHILTGVVSLYEEHISPLFTTIANSVSSIVETLLNAYNTHIAPVLDALGEKFGKVVEEHIKPAIDKFLGFIGSVVDLIKVLWENWLSPLINWMIETFSPYFAVVFELAGGLINSLFQVVSDVFGSIFDVLGGFIDFLVGVFSGDMTEAWEGIKSIWSGMVGYFTGIWDGIKSVFSTVGEFFGNTFELAWQRVIKVFSVGGEIFVDIKDGIITVFKTIVNALITGINSVVKVPFQGLNKILDKIQKLSFLEIEPFKWLNWRLPIPQIPKLATGAVLPPNKPFLAMVGDQKNGTNIEAPLDTIVKAMNIALAQNGGSGRGATEVVLEIDGREFGRAVVEQGDREKRRIGTRLVIA